MGELLARRELHDFVEQLLADAAAGDIRRDVPAGYCLHAFGATSSLDSDAAVDRLVDLTLAGLRPPPQPGSR